MKILSAYLKMDLYRLLPFLGVIGILILIGTGMLYAPAQEFSQMGFLLLRHLPIIFGLILGSDLVARDREQKTRTVMDALPQSPQTTFMFRSMFRLIAIILLWALMVGYTEHFLGMVFPGKERITQLVQWWQKEVEMNSQNSVLILSVFCFFSGTLCSMFAPDTLTAMGLSAAVAVSGSLANSHYKYGMTGIILIMTCVLAGLSLRIYTSRRTWDLRTQCKYLLTGGFVVLLTFLFF